jgi:membrane carboxypeptidase/penicillin-binding protein
VPGQRHLSQSPASDGRQRKMPPVERCAARRSAVPASVAATLDSMTFGPTLYFPYVNSNRFKSFIFLAAQLLLRVACPGEQTQASAALEPVIAKLMAGKPGAVVVLDVSSGKIVAQSNLRLAAQRVTTPGSVVKPFVLMELLQSGKIDPEQHLVCHRPLTIAGKRMDCTHSPAITNLDAADAIAYSCNSYFAQVAVRLSPSELAGVFERAGFTARTGLAEDEAVGRVVRAANQPHFQLQALGYWGVEVTPLELLSAYRGLALQKIKNGSQAAPVLTGLERSVQYGMAHTDATQAMGITAAGKTGTATGPTSQTHGFFAGYAPVDKPEIVLVVYLDHGRGVDAAAIAAPIFTAYGKATRGAAR